ncbi:MAG: porin [Pelomonas sp.]|nr:porin [Roseateles sp.]
MKRLAWLAMAAVPAGALPAQAQDDVEIYGRVNTSVESQRSGDAGRVVVLQNNASRFGLRGREDLGGGLQAGFNLESGFDSTNGAQTAASLFNRQSELNLRGDFGTLRLGNWIPDSYFATADDVSMHNHDTGTSADAFYGGPFPRTDKFGYVSPLLAGVQVWATLQTANAAPGDRRGVDLAARYDQGPLHLGAGYSQQDRPDPLRAGALSDFSQFALRGRYVLPYLVFGGYYQRIDNGADGRRSVYRAAAMVPVGALEFHLNVGLASRTVTLPRAVQHTLACNYNLSPRTKVYAFYTAQDARHVVDRAGDFNALALGVRHNF